MKYSVKLKIRKQVEELCSSKRITIPVDMHRLFKEYKIKLVEENLDDSLSGMIVMGDDQTAVVLNERHSDRRKKFTMAHEMGHYILHYKPGKKFIDALPKYRKVTGIGESTSYEEVEANFFAAELLMPYQEIRDKMKKYRDPYIDDVIVRALARLFEVSQHAMSVRLSDLGYVHIESIY